MMEEAGVCSGKTCAVSEASKTDAGTTQPQILQVETPLDDSRLKTSKPQLSSESIPKEKRSEPEVVLCCCTLDQKTGGRCLTITSMVGALSVCMVLCTGLIVGLLMNHSREQAIEETRADCHESVTECLEESAEIALENAGVAMEVMFGLADLTVSGWVATAESVARIVGSFWDRQPSTATAMDTELRPVLYSTLHAMWPADVVFLSARTAAGEFLEFRSVLRGDGTQALVVAQSLSVTDGTPGCGAVNGTIPVYVSNPSSSGAQGSGSCSTVSASGTSDCTSACSLVSSFSPPADPDPSAWVTAVRSGTCTKSGPGNRINATVAQANAVAGRCCALLSAREAGETARVASTSSTVYSVFGGSRFGAPGLTLDVTMQYSFGSVTVGVDINQLGRSVRPGPDATLYLPSGFIVYMVMLEPSAHAGLLIAASRGSSECRNSDGSYVPLLAEDSDDDVISQHARNQTRSNPPWGQNSTDDDDDDKKKKLGPSKPTPFKLDNGTVYIVRASRRPTSTPGTIYVALLWLESEVIDQFQQASKGAESRFSERHQTVSDDQLKRDRNMIIAAVLSVAGLVVGSIIFSWRLTMSITRLEEQMSAVSTMQLDELDQSRLSRLYDVRSMQLSFREMIKSLREFRTYLPDYVLQGDRTDVSSDDGDDEHSSPGSFHRAPGSMFTTASQRQRLKKLQAVGHLRNRRGTLVSGALHATPNEVVDNVGETLQSFATVLIECVKHYGGSIILLTGAKVVASWNCIRSHPGHALQGCNCAVQAASMLAAEQQESPSWCLCIATGNVWSGAVGTVDSRAPVAVGPPTKSVARLTALAEQLRLTVIADQFAYEGARSQIRARLIDVVTDKAGAVHRVFELLNSDCDTSLWNAQWAQAFAALLRGDYKDSKTRFEGCVQVTRDTDAQSLRLLRLAQHFARGAKGQGAAGAEGYVRRERAPFADHELAAGLAAPTGDSVISMSSPARQKPPVSPLHPVTLNAGSSYGDTPLLQTPADVGSRLRSKMRADRMSSVSTGSQYGELPERFIDEKGCEWFRSETLLGKGAYGAVWLAMSPDGGIVAVKSQRVEGAAPAGAGAGAGMPDFAATGSYTSWGSGGAVSAPPSITGEADAMNGAAARAGASAAPSLRAGIASYRPPAASVRVTPAPVVTPEASTRGQSQQSTEPVSADSPWAAAGATLSAGLSEALSSLISEIRLLSGIRHENVVSFLGCTIESGHVLVVMEYLPGGSLADLLKKFGNALPEPSVRRFSADIVRGLDHLHGQDVVHLDLKPGNVLVTLDGQAKLADFGMSATLKDLVGDACGVRGTPVYMAPEQARGHSEKASDIWAFGIMLAQLQTGRLPWPIVNTPDFDTLSFIYRLGHDSGMEPEIPGEDMVEDARLVAVACLKRTASERPLASQLLCEPYFL
eukprot:TRINITY_DN4754_c0_g1_i1.p1 TRINITY_DN4754_c0_g1~~TRINITY_DN4754_c0_g1_i1.p1  ORF type:complete len:1408 (+),score=337.87 TRINITY_DN4754_c0_g1_i1:52-4275(+)